MACDLDPSFLGPTLLSSHVVSDDVKSESEGRSDVRGVENEASGSKMLFMLADDSLLNS